MKTNTPKTRKLRMNRETLKVLDRARLANVEGGFTSVILPGPLSGNGETCGGWSCWWCH